MTTTATGPRLGFFDRLEKLVVKVEPLIKPFADEIKKAYEAEKSATRKFTIVMSAIAGGRTKVDYAQIISGRIRRGDLGVVPDIQKGDVLRYLSGLIPTNGDDAIDVGVDRVRDAARLNEDDFWTLVRGTSHNPISDFLDAFKDARENRNF